MPISLAGPCALATEAQVVELSGVRKCFSLIGGPPRRLHVNNVVRICIDTQIGFLFGRTS